MRILVDIVHMADVNFYKNAVSILRKEGHEIIISVMNRGNLPEVANKEFSANPDLKGLLIGGPGMTKEKFLAGDYLHTEIKKKVIAVKDLSYTGEFGLEELVNKSQDELALEEIMKERKMEVITKIG